MVSVTFGASRQKRGLPPGTTFSTLTFVDHFSVSLETFLLSHLKQFAFSLQQNTQISFDLFRQLDKSGGGHLTTHFLSQRSHFPLFWRTKWFLVLEIGPLRFSQRQAKPFEFLDKSCERCCTKCVYISRRVTLPRVVSSRVLQKKVVNYNGIIYKRSWVEIIFLAIVVGWGQSSCRGLTSWFIIKILARAWCCWRASLYQTTGFFYTSSYRESTHEI